jgi:hypothetical protein
MALEKPLTKKQRLKKLQLALDPNSEHSPRSVLIMQCHWFSDEAQALTEELIAALRKQNTRAETLLSLYRELIQHRKDAIDCASKAAAYVHPKKEAISVENKSEMRFVFSCPEPIASTEEWLAKCKKDMASRVIKTDLDIDRAIAASKQAAPTLRPIEDFEDGEIENPLDEIPE